MKKILSCLLLCLLTITISTGVFAEEGIDQQADTAANAYLESQMLLFEENYGITDSSVLSLSEKIPLTVFDYQKVLKLGLLDSAFSKELDAITTDEPCYMYVVYADKQPVTTMLLHYNYTASKWSLLELGGSFRAEDLQAAVDRINPFTSVQAENLHYFFSGVNLYAYTPGRVGYFTAISDEENSVYTTRTIINGLYQRTKEANEAIKNGENPYLKVGGTDGIIQPSIEDQVVQKPLSFWSMYRNEIWLSVGVIVLLAAIIGIAVYFVRRKKA